METIFAQATRPGKAGVAIFRISGPRSLRVLKLLCNPSKLDSNNIKSIQLSEDITDNGFIPNIMQYRKIFNPLNSALIDHAMVVYFQAPASFTGEEVVEIHVHGSIAIARILTEVLLNSEGLRLAEPGEFAKRAFLNGKMDLTAAEGLADLIEAETAMQHKQAIRQMEGELGKLYEYWRIKLLGIISLLEAYIDFPDEDIPPAVLGRVCQGAEEIKNGLQDHLRDNRRGELLRAGIKLSIVGRPNVGKSSLLNFLLQREVAIVSDIAGTTRDVIEGHLDIGGYPIILQDTAGIRTESTDVIEQEGIKRALKSAEEADIKIIMLELTSSFQGSQNEEIVQLLNKLSPDPGELIDDNTILVVNKIDLLTAETLKKLEKNIIAVSVKNYLNLDKLINKIQIMAEKIAGINESPHITRLRHRHQLTQALECLNSFTMEGDLVLAAEDIRMAIRSLGNITGKITVDEILGEIFSNFCIGK